MKKVLIVCEYSGITREAFSALGWDATSCDILPTEIPGQHIQGDCLSGQINYKNYDLMIAHPPCTYLSKAGLHFNINNEARTNKTLSAAQFFIELFNKPVQHICIENPVGYINKHITPHSQLINPYYFGDNDYKETSLWLKNLPLLQYFFEDDLFNTRTAQVKPLPAFTWINKKGKIKNEYFTYNKTQKNRSKSFPNVAKAMANQWSSYINQL